VLSINFTGISQYDSAMIYLDKALEATEWMKHYPEKYDETQIDDGFSKIYGTIGNVYNVQGKYLDAIAYYQKALKIFEKNDWKESQTVAYTNIGEMYQAMDNYLQAEINFLKADSLAQITGDLSHIAGSKFYLSKLYIRTKDYAKALQYAETASDYYFSHPEEGMAKAELFNLLSEIYLEGYDDDLRAEEYVQQALALLDEQYFPTDRAISLRVLSTIYLKRGQWRQAQQSAFEALATDDSEPANTLALYEILSKSY
jgi:tetratricopeptide (TPR) repeat protein